MALVSVLLLAAPRLTSPSLIFCSHLSSRTLLLPRLAFYPLYAKERLRSMGEEKGNKSHETKEQAITPSLPGTENGFILSERISFPG